MHPTISIIVPVFNVDAYLDECINSIISQSFSNYEIIIVDDASTDSSKAIAERHASANSFINLAVHEKNQGLGAARNTGVSYASGEYIFFLDSDDMLADKYVLEYLANHSELTRAPVIVGSAQRLSATGQIEQIDGSLTTERHDPVDTYIEGQEALLGSLGVPGHPYLPMRAWGLLIKKSFYINSKFRFLPFEHEDMALVPFIYFLSENVYFDSKVVVTYRERPNSLSLSTWSAPKCRRYGKLFLAFKEQLLSLSLDRHISDSAAIFLNHYMWRISMNGIDADGIESAAHVAEIIGRSGSVINARPELLRNLLWTSRDKPLRSIFEFHRSEILDALGPNKILTTSSVTTHESVNVIFTTGPKDSDYRAFSYIKHILSHFPEDFPINISILGNYRGPKIKKLRRQNKNLLITIRQCASIAIRKLSFANSLYKQIYRNLVLRRLTADRFVGGISKDYLDAVSFIQSWYHKNSKLVIFAETLRSGLRLIEAAYLFSDSELQGIVVVISQYEKTDQHISDKLENWGVTILRDGNYYADSCVTLLQDSGDSFNYPALDFNYPAETFFRDSLLPRANWLAILSNSKLTQKNPEKVLFIHPDWKECGSATSFEKIRSIYNSRGSILIDIALNPYQGNRSAHKGTTRYVSNPDNNSIALELIAFRINPLIAAVKSLITWLRFRPKTIAGFLPLLYSTCESIKVVKSLAKCGKIDYFYVNHYFSLLYAKQLNPKLPILLDSHDLQSINIVSHDYHRSYNIRAASFSKNLEEELSFMDLADCISFVNTEEHQIFKQRRPLSRSFSYIPLPKFFGSRKHQLFKSCDVVSLPLNALILASRNAANKMSITWFLSEVWPMVDSSLYRLFIVGSVSELFPGYAAPNVSFIGPVDNLMTAYSDCDIVILPVTNGGGIAIKTLEALGLGLPVAATRHAMRGLPSDVRSIIPGCRTNLDLASDLNLLANNLLFLSQRSQQVRKCQSILISKGYDFILSEYLNALKSDKLSASSLNREGVRGS